MKILVVEDEDKKAEDVSQFLMLCTGDDVVSQIDRSAYLGEAIRLVSSSRYDLIVLDLMLPYLADGEASSRAGVELLQQIRLAGGLNATTAVVGLSAYPDEVAEYRNKFDDAGVLIVKYNVGDGWKATLARVVDDIQVRLSFRAKCDFLVIVALEEERIGFDYTNLESGEDLILFGLNLRRVTLAVQGEKRSGFILKLRSMGLVASVMETTIALQAIDTPVVCMSGICAGFKDRTKVGQVVVASPAWEYQAGKWSENGFEIAPEQVSIPAATRVIVDQVLSSKEALEALDAGLPRAMARPTVWSNPILAPGVTGSAVIADADRIHHVEKQHRKVAALDMETFGVYYACFECKSTVKHFFSAKCVVDLADSGKSDDIHDYGCAISARMAENVLCQLLTV